MCLLRRGGRRRRGHAIRVVCGGDVRDAKVTRGLGDCDCWHRSRGCDVDVLEQRASVHHVANARDARGARRRGNGERVGGCRGWGVDDASDVGGSAGELGRGREGVMSVRNHRGGRHRRCRRRGRRERGRRRGARHGSGVCVARGGEGARGERATGGNHRRLRADGFAHVDVRERAGTFR